MPALGYFMTWVTYGSWLPGDERGWISRKANWPGVDIGRPSRNLHDSARLLMPTAEVELTECQRKIVERAVAEVCKYREWELKITNCRTQHVHAVVTGDFEPNAAMGQFKSYATRALRQAGQLTNQEPWARHGSSRALNTEDSLAAAISYVRDQ